MRLRNDSIESESEQAFVAKIADSLAHPVRVQIVEYVGGKEAVRNDVCNGDLVACLPFSQSTVSQHVKKLVEAGVLIVRRLNGFSYYSVDRQLLENFRARICRLVCPDDGEAEENEATETGGGESPAGKVNL